MVERNKDNSITVGRLKRRNRLLRRWFFFLIVAIIIVVWLLLRSGSYEFTLEDVAAVPRRKSNSNGEKCEKGIVFNNSETWLAGPRLGNANDTSLTLDIIRDLIINVNPDLIINNVGNHKSAFSGAMPVLKRTICTENSKFMKWEDPVEAAKNLTARKDVFDLRKVAFRVLYLAIHEHQHRPAREEAKLRFSCANDNDNGSAITYLKPSPLSMTEKNNATTTATSIDAVGDFDFECPNSKFIAATIKTEGMGASIRFGAVTALRLGIATGRVVIFPHHWGMASCDRHDFQCFFMPASPCVITNAELANAPTVTEDDLRKGKYDDVRVVILKTSAMMMTPGGGLGNVVLDILKSMYGRQNAPAINGISDNSTTTNDLTETDELLKKIVGAMTAYIQSHAMTLYLMRPNVSNLNKVNHAIKDIFPSNFDPETAIGIPIRASDRIQCDVGPGPCGLSFDQYMTIAKRASELAAQEKGRPGFVHKTIVVTSESKPFIEARHNYTRNKSTDEFPFSFIINDQDISQASGHPSQFESIADDVMISTFTSLKMQLMTESTVGNCCSAFHKLMGEFLSNGCGEATTNHFECLQQNENPMFRSCCRWGFSYKKECEGRKVVFSGSNTIYVEPKPQVRQPKNISFS